MTEAIVCSGLRKSFGKVRAVNGVDLAVEPGVLMTLLGPSGCGKTTVLRLIAGFEHADAGAITIAGRTVSGPGVHVPPEKRRVGMVFQDYALFPHHDVAWNIAYGLSRATDKRERVAEVLALVGLAGHGKRMPHELSGGEQQRIALARALAPRPDIILMDEPFSNLDARLRVRVRGEIREILRAAGTTAIFVTHDQEEALSLSDVVGVMWRGELVQAGSPESIYRRPASRVVADFLGDADFVPGTANGNHVETPFGSLALRDAIEGAVDVLIRPEDVRLALAVVPDGAVSAEVCGREFYGHDQVVALRTEQGQLIHARLGPDDLLAPGSRVGVTVRGPVVAFPRD